MAIWPRLQCGFSLVSAIFLLVVIAALGAFALTISTAQQKSAALDVLGSRAYQASRAGIEWGVYQVLQNSAAAFASTCQTAGTNSQVLPAGTLGGTLAGFSVSVGCDATSTGEATTTIWLYSISSTATQGTPGAIGYVERKMTVTIGK